jgi:predicted HicB family RNase H-like nuclease
MTMADHYTYRLSWSAEDQEHVATCAEFPGLSWLDEDEVEALRGVQRLVREVVEDLRASGEPVPEPLADKDFSGKFMVRVPPDVHRRLALRAAEERVSLNRYVSAKLAAAGC